MYDDGVNERMENIFRSRSELDAYARTFENSSLDEDLITRGFLYSSFLSVGGMTIVSFFTKKYLALYMEHQLVYISPIIILP